MNGNRSYRESVRTARGVMIGLGLGLLAWIVFMILWILLLGWLGR